MTPFMWLKKPCRPMTSSVHWVKESPDTHQRIEAFKFHPGYQPGSGTRIGRIQAQGHYTHYWTLPDNPPTAFQRCYRVSSDGGQFSLAAEIDYRRQRAVGYQRKAQQGVASHVVGATFRANSSGAYRSNTRCSCIGVTTFQVHCISHLPGRTSRDQVVRRQAVRRRVTALHGSKGSRTRRYDYLCSQGLVCPDTR